MSPVGVVIATMIVSAFPHQTVAAIQRDSGGRYALYRVDTRTVPALQKEISLSLKSVTLDDALEAIAARANIPLTYSKNVLPSSGRVSLRADKIVAEDALRAVLKDAGLDILALSTGQVVVVRAERRPDVLTDEAVPPVVAPITGRVTDSRGGQPLSGASIMVEGLPIGASTADSGKYRIAAVPFGPHTLVARRLGYAPVRTTAHVRDGGRTIADFALEPLPFGLQAIVVSVDVASTRRVEIGTDIVRIAAEQLLNRAAVSSASELLASRTAGVDVRKGTGPVGTAQPIRVRGVASLINGSNPLILIDGNRASNNTASGPASIDWAEGRTISRLDDLNPADIASVQVIKGPTATALYGSEAASGVIIIETKRGNGGAPQVNASTELGQYEDASEYSAINKHFNLTRYLRVRSLDDPIARQFGAVQNPVTRDIWGVSNPMTNALTDPRRIGGASNTNVSLRGGNFAARYFVSAQYEDTKGVFVNNWLKRGSIRANLDVVPHGALQLAFSTAYVTSDIRLPESSRSFRGYSTNAGVGAPINSYGVRPDGTRGDCLATLETNANPVATCTRYQGNLSANFDDLNTVYSGQETGRFIGSAAANWTPVRWLSSRLTLGLDNTQNFDLNKFPLDAARPFGLLSSGFIRDSRQTTNQQSVDATSTITVRPRESIASSTTVGAQYFRVDDQLAGCTGEHGFASATATACNAALVQTGFSGSSENVQIGAYFQQRVSYRDMAFATSGLRVDENSAFGSAVGAIWSPSINASLVISEMPFWRWRALNSLRLRGAYGSSAQAPPPYAADERLEPTRLTTGLHTEAAVSALYPGNPHLGPERKSEVEFGADASFWNERISVNATYYRQKIKDALLSRLLAPSLGYRANQLINAAELRNSGTEMAISAALLTRPSVTWDVELSVATQNPIVTSMGGQTDVFLGNDRGMMKAGYAPGAYYGPIVASATRDASGAIVPGSIVYRDCPDLPQNYCYHGSPQPKDIENLTTTLGLFGGRLRLHTVFDRRGHVTKNNGTKAFLVGFHRDRGAPLEYAFRESNVNPAVQAAMEERLRGVTNADSFFWHEDGSFIKWRELSATYDLPTGFFKRFHTGGMALTLGARNLATITNYSGIDPESFVRGGLATIGGNEEFFGEAVPRYFFVRLRLSSRGAGSA